MMGILKELLMPKFCISTPAQQLENASMDPAERSMPPRRMTQSIPTAIKATIGVWRRILIILLKVTNCPLVTIARKTQTTIRASNMPIFPMIDLIPFSFMTMYLPMPLS